jgi:hypothetical protein
MATMKNKPVSFNLDNPNDQRRFEHVQGINFSGYVKSLIDRDMRKPGSIQTPGKGITIKGGVAKL